MRTLFLRVLWPLTWPVRRYWIHSERKLGKKLLVDRVLKQLLPPPPAGFVAQLPGGGKAFLHYREDIGLVALMSGGFERAEILAAVDRARAGTVVIDVGANVGVFTVPLALKVGTSGRVLSIEPSPDNVSRLRDNVALNDLENVVVRAVAAADRGGELQLRLGVDPAFHSTTAVAEAGRTAGEAIAVPAETLDHLWEAEGSPAVSLVKVDTEGGELAVLRGAQRLFERCRPALLLEARGDGDLDEWLDDNGYTRTHPRGFAPGNFLCLPTG